MKTSSKFHLRLKRLSAKKKNAAGIGQDISPAVCWQGKGRQGSGQDKKKYFEKGITPLDRVKMIRALMPEKRGENYNSQRLQWVDELLEIVSSLESENLRLRRKVAQLQGREKRREAYAKKV